jgi:hypothetical protein
MHLAPKNLRVTAYGECVGNVRLSRMTIPNKEYTMKKYAGIEQ